MLLCLTSEFYSKFPVPYTSAFIQAWFILGQKKKYIFACVGFFGGRGVFVCAWFWFFGVF